MKLSVPVIALSFVSTLTVFSAEPVKFHTDWLSLKPEVLTYRSTSPQGEGLFQLSAIKTSTNIEVYVNMLMPGFTKTKAGIWTTDCRLVESNTKIIIDNQIIMNTNCFYMNNSLEISTTMIPYNTNSAQSIALKEQYIDFSQIPFIARAMEFSKQKEYVFASVNPRLNTPSSVTVKAIGDTTIHNIPCIEVAVTTFEGTATAWVELAAPYRTSKQLWAVRWNFFYST